MTFGRHIRQTHYHRHIAIAVVCLLLAGFVGAGIGTELADVQLEEEAHAAAAENTSGKAKTTNKNSVPQSTDQASSPTQVAMSAIATIDGSAEIATSGFTLSADAQAAVQSQIANFTNGGYTASFVLADITTGRAIAYNADAQIYSASSAKAPYLMSLFSTGTVDLNTVYQPTDEQTATIQQKVDVVLRNSDNDAYDWLYHTYGLDCFNTWAAQAGASSTMGPDRGGYMFTSARDMARLWTAGYGFLFAGQTSGAQNIAPEALQWLSGEMTNSLNSNIHAALGGVDTVYTKAGWINGEGDLYALNDAGLVASQSGTYVLAVLTDACGRNDLLTGLISTLDAVHSGDTQA